MKKKILIFYISEHSGHFYAASAIEKGLMEVGGESVEVEKINAFGYTNPVLEKIINKAYLEVIKKKPDIWGKIYDNPDVVNKTRKAREALHTFNMAKIERLLEEQSPAAIFCTQAFPCGMIADYKRARGRKTPLIGVLTDNAAHSYWLSDEVDIYVVPFEETARALERKGVPYGKIRVYGIPVDPRFRARRDTRPIKRDLGLEDDAPTVLIMGGSQGLGAMEEVVASFLGDAGSRYQLLVVTGSNKKLYARLKRLSRGEVPNNIHILPYVENIDELMDLADVIVTKAGGMTMAEALVKKLPILVVNPIPGQERMNADYLVGKGAAVEIEDSARIREKLTELFDSEGALDRMKKSIERLAKPNSASDIARLAFFD